MNLNDTFTFESYIDFIQKIESKKVWRRLNVSDNPEHQTMKMEYYNEHLKSPKPEPRNVIAHNISPLQTIISFTDNQDDTIDISLLDIAMPNISNIIFEGIPRDSNVDDVDDEDDEDDEYSEDDEDSENNDESYESSEDDESGETIERFSMTSSIISDDINQMIQYIRDNDNSENHSEDSENSTEPIINNDQTLVKTEYIAQKYPVYKSIGKTNLGGKHNALLFENPIFNMRMHQRISYNVFQTNELISNGSYINILQTECVRELINKSEKIRIYHKEKYPESTEIDNYIQYIYEFCIDKLFTSLLEHNVTIDIDKFGGYSDLVNFVMLCDILYNDRSVELFRTFLETTNFVSSTHFCYIMFREPSCLAKFICTKPEILKELLNKISLLKFLKMINTNDKSTLIPLLRSTLCKELLLSCSSEEINEISDFLLDFRYNKLSENMTIMHLLFIICDAKSLSEIIVTYPKLRQLINVPDDHGFFPYHYIFSIFFEYNESKNNISAGTITTYIDEKLMTIDNLFTSENNNEPLIYSNFGLYILLLFADYLSADIINKYLDVIINAEVMEDTHTAYFDLLVVDEVGKIIVDIPELLMKKVRLLGYDEEYPIIAYLSYCGILEKWATVQNEAISEILKIYPFLLPFDLYNTLQHKHSFPILATTLLDIGQWEYLSLYFKTLIVDMKNYDLDDISILSDTMRAIMTHDKLSIEFVNANNNLLLFAEYCIICTSEESEEYQEITSKYYTKAAIINVMEYIWNTFIKTKKRATYYRVSYHNLITHERKTDLDTVIEFMQKKPKWFKTCLYFDPELLIDILRHEKFSLTFDDIFDNKFMSILSELIEVIDNHDIDIYDHLINNNYLDGYFDANVEDIIKLIIHGNPTLTEYISKLPGFDKNKIYTSAVSQNELKEIIKQSDNNGYFLWLIRTFDPPNEYKYAFIKNFEEYINETNNHNGLPFLTNGFLKPEVFNNNVEEYISAYVDMIDLCDDIEIHLNQIDFTDIKILSQDIDLSKYERLVFKLLENTTHHNIIRYYRDVDFGKIVDMLLLDKHYIKDLIDQQAYDTAYVCITNSSLNKKDLWLTKIDEMSTIEHIMKNLECMVDYSVNYFADFIEKDPENLKFALDHLTTQTLEDILDNLDNFMPVVNTIMVASDPHDFMDYIIDNNNTSLLELIIQHAQPGIDDELAFNCNTILLKLEIYDCINKDVLISNLHAIDFNTLDLYANYFKRDEFKDKLSQFYAECPSLLICNISDIDKYAPNMDIRSLRMLVINKNITSHIQDKILYLIKDDISKLNIILDKISLYSDFLANESSTVIDAISKNNKLYNNIISLVTATNNDITKNYMFLENTLGDYMFSSNYVKNDDVIKEFAIEVTFDDLISTNKRKIQKIAKLMEDAIISKYLLQRDDISNIFNKSQYIGKLIFEGVLKYIKSSDDIKTSIDRYPESFKKYVDTNNKNLLSNLIMINNVKITNYIYNFILELNDDNRDNYLLTCDDVGNNLLFNAVLHNSNMFKQLITIYFEYYQADVFAYNCVQNMTLLMYAYKCNNIDAVDMILSDDRFGFEQNYKVYSSGSALSHAVTHNNVDYIEKLIDWEHFDKETIIFPKTNVYVPSWINATTPLVEVKLSPIEHACILSLDIFKLLEEKFDDKAILNFEISIDDVIYNIFSLAYQYSPTVFQYLANKYNSLSINLPIKEFIIASQTQPYSWYLLLNSYQRELILYLNKHSLHMNSLIEYDFPHNLFNSSNKMSNYIQTTQEYSIDPVTRCHICCMGKKKILFACHKHMTCVQCACKLYECPDCRAKTDDSSKIKLFD